MGSELLALRSQLRRYLAVARVCLAVACLALQFFLVPDSAAFISLALVFFTVYSLIVVAARQHLQSGVFGLLTLFTDTVFFLILTNYGADRTLWLPAAFYLYLLIGAVMLYTSREVVIVVSVCILFFSLVQPSHWFGLQKCLVVTGIFGYAFSSYKKYLETNVEALAEEAKLSRSAAEKARELEGQRIAADFHDGPLQSLLSFHMRLEILRKLLERDRGGGLEELQQLQSLSKTQITELRSFVRSMRPLEVEGTNLAAAARRVAEDFQKESGIPVTFVGGEIQVVAAQETCADVLRIIREALHNVQKHARATRVAVGMEKVGKTLELSVDDNGVGFKFSGVFTLDELELMRKGPHSIKQRARSLNADLVLESRPESGAGLKMKIPI